MRHDLVKCVCSVVVSASFKSLPRPAGDDGVLLSVVCVCVCVCACLLDRHRLKETDRDIGETVAAADRDNGETVAAIDRDNGETVAAVVVKISG